MAKYVTQDLAACFISSLPHLTLVYYRNRWWRFSRLMGWHTVNDGEVKSLVTKFMWETFNRDSGSRQSVTENRVKDVMLCIQAVLMIPTQHEQRLDPTVFLTFENGDMTATPAEGWIATQTHLLHVPRVAVALHRGDSIPEDAVRPLDSRLFSPGMVPCAWDEEAICPVWDRFLSEVCPVDGESLEASFGLSLTYNRQYHVLFVLHGEAASGKSTALGVLEKLNQGVTSHVQLGALGNTFSPYKLTFSRANIVQELENVTVHSRNVHLREAVMKSCACGEMGEVELKFHNAEDRYYTALQFYGCNALPKFSDRSHAISRRLRIFQFPNTFSAPGVRDNSLAEKLHAELPGILVRVLRAYGKLLESGNSNFPESESAAEIKAELIKSTRPEELFCDEYLLRVDDENARLSTDDIYRRCKQFCADNGFTCEDRSVVIPLLFAYMKTKKKRIRVGDSNPTFMLGVRYSDGYASAAEIIQPAGKIPLCLKKNW